MQGENGRKSLAPSKCSINGHYRYQSGSIQDSRSYSVLIEGVDVSGDEKPCGGTMRHPDVSNYRKPCHSYCGEKTRRGGFTRVQRPGRPAGDWMMEEAGRNQVKMKSYSNWMGLNPINWVLRRTHTHTHGRRPCEDGGTDHRQPRSTKDCCRHEKLRESHGTGSSLDLSERAGPSQHFDFGLPTSRTVEEYISIILSHPGLQRFVTAALGN